MVQLQGLGATIRGENASAYDSAGEDTVAKDF